MPSFSEAPKDREPRYAPENIIICARHMRVITGYRIHQPGNHPEKCPLVPDCVALEVMTHYGSRWFGIEKAWINSEMRVVVQGFDAKDEILSHWQKCTTV